jgi:GT2 family glycosyltransferase
VGTKFLFVGDQKLYVCGVTYGTLRPGPDGGEYDPWTVERDFAEMGHHRINAVRTYTVPPRWLLDAAVRHGLRVLVGLPWEQHVAFLDEPGRADSIEERVRAGVRACAGHSAVLGYAIGNEIPASIVRWHGARPIERFLERLYRAAKAEDPDRLVTYVNYPSTEYLHLPFLDFVSFNVYLEGQDELEAYVARLQNIAGDRPLLLADLGLDSRRHGEETQAVVLDWQIRASFAEGCAGVFVFAWTDEWWRGGFDVEDWDFGLTDRARQPKPALAAVREAFADVPFPADMPWPRVSVVVCSHNGARTIGDALAGVAALRYPDHEVIVVDDGSTDRTAAIARAHGAQVISTPNRGLAAARNVGLAAATGEIVAYLDDDARPDPDWLTYLAATFMTTDHAGVGGPNVPPPGDGWIADCVANAPGGPLHVLLADRVAEHIPGCNSAFRRACLEAIGGYDPQFRAAGDDVDVCWRLQERGWTLGFHAGAAVWHHRRGSVGAYARQQQGYGKAEAQLERKWPGKYNGAGHVTWGGRVYGGGLTLALGWKRARIYRGVWGSAAFQHSEQIGPGVLRSLPLMPEWYLLTGGLALLAALGAVWRPLLLCLPLLALALGAMLFQAGASAARASFTAAPRGRSERWRMYTVTALLHLLQPLYRLRGRLQHGLTPWRLRGVRRWAAPRTRRATIWSEHWRAPEAWVGALEARLQRAGVGVQRGGVYDRWDLETRAGGLGAVRARLTVEEHGGGRQLVRLQSWPRVRPLALGTGLPLALLAGGACLDGAWLAAAVLAGAVGAIGLCALWNCSVSAATLAAAQQGLATDEASPVPDEPRPEAIPAEPTLDRVYAVGVPSGSHGREDDRG